jgi:hypothetical protein
LSSEYLLNHCLHIRDTSSPIGTDDGASDSGYASSPVSRSDVKQYDLYIAAPATLTREQAFAYHLTTRNFFAYALGRPVVGERLGTALAGLLDRIKEWLPGATAETDFLGYCQRQGYQDTARKVEHAVACLSLAEYSKLKDLWMDSFVHCVGMHEQLEFCSEYDGLSNTTKALITRASLEMELHIARVIRALGTFLEEELGIENLGLGKPARDHLDRFRSFLHNYYVEKLGYFPPKDDGPYNKRLWTKMYHSFQTLYEYLVDNESSTDPSNMRNLTGGICVAQNIQAFDQRHGYTALPHPLPLLPALPAKKRATDGQRSLRAFNLGVSDIGSEAKYSSKHALAQATNSQKPEVLACKLVHEYQAFERQKLEEKLTIAEARKVRWILVYGVLQMLISITRAPKEVRDTESPTYPLCVLTTGCPAWLEEQEAISPQDPSKSFLQAMLTPETLEDEDREEKISIHPDCEAESAEDYFSSRSFSRRPSQVDADAMTPHPLRVTTQLSRTASLRSSVHSGVHALQRSFSRRNSIRKTPTNRPGSIGGSFCEILVEGYGNGADSAEDLTRRSNLAEVTEATADQVNDALAAFDFEFGLNDVNEEPILEDAQVGRLLGSLAEHPHMDEGIMRRDSELSMLGWNSSNRSSTRSSTLMMEFESPVTEPSSTGEDEYKPDRDGHRWSVASGLPSPGMLQKRHSYQQQHLNFGVRTSSYSVSAGCYTPTGLRSEKISPPLSKFCQPWTQSSGSESDAWSPGSEYPPDDRQAAEIEEEEPRGRRRSRALDRLSLHEMEAEGRSLVVG